MLGLGSIVLVFFLGRELFSTTMGLLASALLTVFHGHIHFSRVGHHYIHALFAVLLTLLLLAIAVRRGWRMVMVGTGIVLGIDLQVYYAARVAYVIVPILLLFVLVTSGRGDHSARGSP